MLTSTASLHSILPNVQTHPISIFSQTVKYRLRMNSCDSSTSFGADFVDSGILDTDFGVFGVDFRVLTVFGNVLYSLAASGIAHI